jgi:ATP-dependent exoDNAse (exonuclease V) beta subunit
MFIIKKASNIKKDGSVGAYTGVFDIDGIEPCTLGNLKISNSADTHITQRNKVSFDLKDHGRQKVEEKVEDIKNIDDSAKYFGLALHLSLEMIDFKNPDKSLDEAMEFAISKSAGVVDEIKLRNAITTVLSSDGFNEVIAQKELFKECSFFFDGKVKRIDLLALGHGLAVVVDYKSSMFQRDEHKKQIATYSKAVNEILQISTQTMLLTTGQI